MTDDATMTTDKPTTASEATVEPKPQPLFSEKAERGFNNYMCMIGPVIPGFALTVRDSAVLFMGGMNEMESHFTPEELGVDASIGFGLVTQAASRASRKLVNRHLPTETPGTAITPVEVVRQIAKGIDVLGEVFLAIQDRLDASDMPSHDDFLAMAKMRLALRKAAEDVATFSKDGVCEQPLQGICLDLTTANN